MSGDDDNVRHQQWEDWVIMKIRMQRFIHSLGK